MKGALITSYDRAMKLAASTHWLPEMRHGLYELHLSDKGVKDWPQFRHTHPQA
jgi:hypothetical protein